MKRPQRQLDGIVQALRRETRLPNGAARAANGHARKEERLHPRVHRAERGTATPPLTCIERSTA
jgi:hypothetical protein